MFCVFCFIALQDNPGFVARFKDENSFVLRNKSTDFKQLNFNQLSQISKFRANLNFVRNEVAQIEKTVYNIFKNFLKLY